MVAKNAHLPQIKKVTHKTLPRIASVLTHCVFVDEQGVMVTDQPTAGIEGLTRIKTKAGLRKTLPAELVVLMVDSNTNVLDMVKARVGSMEQFNIALKELDKDRAAKDEAAKVATIN